MAPKSIHPIVQELIDLIQPPHDGNIARPTSQFGRVRSEGTNPHRGFDQNRGRGVPGPVSSPVFGVIGKVGGPRGQIVIQELDPVTKLPTGYDVEILHTESQFVKPGDGVKPRQPIGMQGGVGVNGTDEHGNGIPGAPHAHLQVYRAGDRIRIPLNPLRHLYEYHHPGEPIPQLPEFFPESVPPRPTRPARPDPLSGKDPVAPDAPLGANGPPAPNIPPRTSPPGKFGVPPVPNAPPRIGRPLDITTPAQRNPPASDDGYVRPDPTGRLYFDAPSSTRQFGPFTLPDPSGYGADMPGYRNSRVANSAIPLSSTPGQIGRNNGYATGAFGEAVNGYVTDQVAGGNDTGSVWTTARQHISGPAERMRPGIGGMSPAPGPFPENGTTPIGYADGANQAGTLVPSVAHRTSFQPLGPLGVSPQPPPAARSLTEHVLRMKGVPEADIGTALNDPAQMQDLLNQLYGRVP